MRPLYGKQAIRSEYINDPRRKMLEAMVKTGSSTAPVQSWGEGLARALQAGIGGYYQGQMRRENEQRQEDYANAMQAALMGGSQGYQMPMPQGVQGPPQMATGLQGMSQAALASGNKDILPQAMEWQMQGMEQERQAQEREDMYNMQQRDRERMAEMQNIADEKRSLSAQQQRLDFFNAQQKAANKRAQEQRDFELGLLERKDTKKTELAQKEKQTTYDMFDTAMNNLESSMQETTTGPFIGSFPAMTSEAQTAEGSMATMAPILKSLFRTAGEGTFTDKDQELLMKMVPTRSDTEEARRNKIQFIRDVVSQKLGVTQPSQTDDAPTEEDEWEPVQ